MTQKLLFLTCIDEAVVVKKLIDSKHLNQAQFKLICWDRNVSDFLDKNNLKNNHISKYIEKVDFDLINFNLMQLIKSFPHKKVINIKSLVELLENTGLQNKRLKNFLLQEGIENIWENLQSSSPSENHFTKQFHRWFDGFKTIRFLKHFT